MWKEFKAFAVGGNVLDLAIGVMIGAAFGLIVASLVEDLVSPIIGLVGTGDFSNMYVVLKPGKDGATTFNSLAAAKEAGATVFAYGSFVNAIIKFLITGFALFMIAKGAQKLKKETPAEPAAPSSTDTLLMEIRDTLKAK